MNFDGWTVERMREKVRYIADILKETDIAEPDHDLGDIVLVCSNDQVIIEFVGDEIVNDMDDVTLVTAQNICKSCFYVLRRTIFEERHGKQSEAKDWKALVLCNLKKWISEQESS